MWSPWLKHKIRTLKPTRPSKSGADLGGRWGWGGGGGADVPFQGFDPLPTQRVSPLVFLRNPALGDQP